MSILSEFDSEMGFLFWFSLDEWLMEQHVAWFVVEVIEGLEL